MKKFKNLITLIIFILVFAILLQKVSYILQRKSFKKPWDMTNKIGGFYNEQENSLDIMFFGSSHAYCSFIPEIIEEKTGQKSYILASQQQPISATYYYIKEALKTQSPNIIIVEVFQGVFDEYTIDEGVIHSFTDEIPFSLNKIAMVFSSVPKGEKMAALFNIIKYHSRWEELKDEDYINRNKLNDPLSGYVRLGQIKEGLTREYIKNPETEKWREKDEKYLIKMIELAKKENFQLILVKTPTTDPNRYMGRINYLENLAKEKNIPFYDFNSNYEEIGIDINKDYYDIRHLNVYGAEKFTNWFQENILPKYIE